MPQQATPMIKGCVVSRTEMTCILWAILRFRSVRNSRQPSAESWITIKPEAYPFIEVGKKMSIGQKLILVQT